MVCTSNKKKNSGLELSIIKNQNAVNELNIQIKRQNLSYCILKKQNLTTCCLIEYSSRNIKTSLNIVVENLIEYGSRKN